MKKIKYLLLLLPFIFINNVKADIVQYKFIDYKSTSATMKQTNFVAYETYTYSRDYVLFNGEDKFFAFNYCATGPFDFSFPNDFEGVTELVGYSQGGHCYVQGYEGYNYTVYFMAKQVHDAGNGNLSIMFNTKISNRSGYNVFINVLSLTSVASIPAGVQIPNYAGDFNTVNTKIDTVQQAVEEVKKAQNANLQEQKKTNDTLNDDTIDSSNTTGTLRDLSNNLPTNSVISDLLLLPVRLFQSIVNSINGSCSSFNLGSLYGSNLTLPCINIESIIGSNLWSVIDILFCGVFVLVIRKKFVDIFHNLTDLRNGGNDLE